MLNTYCKSFDNNNFADTIELNQSLIIYAISSTRKNRKLWEFELAISISRFIFQNIYFLLLFLQEFPMTRPTWLHHGNP